MTLINCLALSKENIVAKKCWETQAESSIAQGDAVSTHRHKKDWLYFKFHGKADFVACILLRRGNRLPGPELGSF